MFDTHILMILVLATRHIVQLHFIRTCHLDVHSTLRIGLLINSYSEPRKTKLLNLKSVIIYCIPLIPSPL